MDILVNLVGFLLTIGILVTVHEYGHFWAARRMGIKVIRFSVGFGKPLYSWYDRHGTEYAIAAIPLGGYVKMVDEREGNVSESDRPFAINRKSVSARIFVASAGPLANFIFAIFAYCLLYMVGVSGLIPKVGNIEPSSGAYMAGLREGDVLTAIDQQPITTWRDGTWALFDRLGETGQIKISTESGKNVEIEIENWLQEVDEPNPLGSLGLVPFYPDILPIIGLVQSGSAAEEAGLQVDDKLLAIDGMPLQTWNEFVDSIKQRPQQPTTLRVERQGVKLELKALPSARENGQGVTEGFLGAGVKSVAFPPELIAYTQLNIVDGFIRAIRDTGQMIVRILDSLKKMVEGLLSVKNLSGPITIAKVAGASATSGFESFVGFLAYVSVMLGVVNLLPIPVLDGGHILYYLIEGIKGKPVSEKVQMAGLQLGMLLLLCVMAIAFYNDIARL